MADNLRKYTTQEVLNKVYTDSSGNSIGLNAATSKETLNAVLTSGADSLNVALSGGTISGDVTIAGDLVVEGGGTQTFSETVTDNISGNFAMFIENQHSNGLGLGVRAGASGNRQILSLQNSTQATMFSVKTNGNIDVGAGGVLQMTNSTINGAPINLLSRDTTVGDSGEGVRLRFGKSDDSFLADFGYRYQSATDKGATVSSTDNLRFVLAGQDNSQFLLKGGDGTTGSSIDIRTYETTVVANDVLGKITFSAPYELSGTDAILAGAEIKAIAASTFDAADNNTSLIFSTASSDAVHGSATDGAVFQRFVIDANSRISLSNNDTGTSNTIFGKSAGDLDGAGDQNVYVGESAGGNGVQTDASDNNVGVGFRALQAITQGASNIGVGKDALYSTTTADNNIGIGSNAAQAYTTIGDNIGIGANSLNLISGGTGKNVAIGTEAMKSSGTASNNDASENVGIGYQALTAITDGDYNVAIGANALAAADGAESNNVAIGQSAMLSVNLDTSEKNIAIGRLALTGGIGELIGNIAIGHLALDATAGTAQAGNIAIGMEALSAQNTATVVGIGDVANPNIAIGYQAGKGITEGDSNVIIGHLSHGKGSSAGRGDDNVYIGARSGYSATDADSNVGIGRDSLYSITTGGNNVAIGSGAGDAITTASFNVAIGGAALSAEDTSGGSIAIGAYALTAQNGNGKNIGIGHQAAVRNTTGEKNVIIGYEAGIGAVSANWSKNIAVGHQALYSLQTDADNNVGIGDSAGYNITTGDNNILIGGEAGDAITTDSRVVAIGKGAYSANDTTNAHDNSGADERGSGNIAIGYNSMTAVNADNALRNTMVGFETMSQCGAADPSDNTGLGYRALYNVNHNDGDNNTAIGSKALMSITEGSSNVAVGSFALDAENTGDENVAIGTNAMGQATGGVNNCVAIGYQALQGALSTTGDNPSGATAVGYEALQNMSSAQYATALGFRAGYSMSGADKATYIGYQAGYAGGSNHHNTYVGYRSGYGGGSGAGGEGNAALGVSTLENVNGGHFNVAIGYQAGNLLTSGDNNIIIGYDADVDANDRNGCIVIGKGLSLNTASDNVVEIGNNTNSMTYDLDGGDITVTSDVRTKKNIQDTKLGLEFINKLRPITYETKPSSEHPKEFGIKEPSNKSSNKTWDGLIAQEVKAVMDDMGVEFSGWEKGINTKQRLAYGKFVMPLIKAVQELSAKVEELEAKLSK